MKMTTPTLQPETAPAVRTAPLRPLMPAAPIARSNQRRNRRARLLAHLVLIVICALALLPFAWMVSTSLKTGERTIDYPPRWIPHPFAWHNYVDVFHHEKANFLLWTRNTLVIAALGVAGTTLSSALVAYGF